MIANSTLNRQNKQHSVKTDETKLVLKQRCIMFAQNINIKQKKELCLWTLNATTARNILFPKMLEHNTMYLDSWQSRTGPLQRNNPF